MTDWRVDVHNLNTGGVLFADLPVQDWMFNYVLNSPGALEADLYVGAAGVTEANLLPGARELRVYRNSDEVWGGNLWNASVDMKANKVRIQAEGYYSRLRRRIARADLIYVDVNVQQIMWNLINHAQGQTNGSLGLTQGAHVGADRTVDMEFCAQDYPNIAEGIDALTQMDDGCDWVITPTLGIYTNKVFRTWQPRKGTDLSGSITLDQDNLFNLTYEYDASDLANWVTYIGPGDCNPPDVLVQNLGAQTTYGLMEEVIESDEFDGINDLTAHAREYLRNFDSPRYLAHAVYEESKGPAFGDFVLGDILSLESNKGFATFTRDMRVVGFQAEMNRSNVNFYDVTLDSVVA